MSFLEHLDELRGVLFSSLLIMLVFAAAAWFFSERLLDFLVVRTVGHAHFIKPLEAFMTRVKLSLLLGLMAGLPFIAFRIWGFVVPGLLHHERRLLLPLVIWSTLLFFLGVTFATAALTPTMLRILMSFGTQHIEQTIAVGYLFDFVLKMALACGLLFQLPLVIALLSHVGLVTPGFLLAKWRHAIVIILIVAAVVTPGDGPSQLVLALPIIILYFVSIWISAGIHRRKRSREDRDGGGQAPTSPGDAGAPSPAGAGDASGHAVEGLRAPVDVPPEPVPPSLERPERLGGEPAPLGRTEAAIGSAGGPAQKPAGTEEPERLNPAGEDWSI
jgi:sec-independent protein translocase protein TatC